MDTCKSSFESGNALRPIIYSLLHPRFLLMFNLNRHSTRDALLIFEAVRRGILPKITRRFRDDERKLIRSGAIFVFDEVESSIKRWTDGLIWSPSRILNNFLVYREVEKKDPKPPADQPAFATSHSGFMLQGGALTATGSDHPAQHSSVRSVPLTLMSSSMDANGRMAHHRQEYDGAYHNFDNISTSSHPIYAEHDAFFAGHSHHHHAAHAQIHAQAAGMVGAMEDSSTSSSAKREAELDRTIVGSLTSSYPFLKNGLCKKTISMQVEGSTQHLISYYTIEDVQKHRLTIPSSLPEISALSISPIFLNKTNFRYPPITEYGPDGIPRYVGESTDPAMRDPAMRAPGHVSSGNESYSSGSEARHDALGRAVDRSLTLYSPGLSSEPAHGDLYSHRHPHQIGGDGMLPVSATLPPTASSATYRNRRSSDAPRRRAKSRYEPYQQAASFGHGMLASHLYTNGPADESALVSPSGRRGLLESSRGYSEAQLSHAPEHGSFAVSRQDADFFASDHMDHAIGQGGAAHLGHWEQQYPSVGQGHLMGDREHLIHEQQMMPIVPSQPGRDPIAYSAGSDNMYGRFVALPMKQDAGCPFHYSSRPARGSWDSGQPMQSNAFVHNVQQPPATSQGLMAIPLHSHSNFGGPAYGRFAGSPPQTASSHDSRHSYMGSGATRATGRIEEIAESLPPTATTRFDDTSYSSRPTSRAGEGGYVGGLESAGVVRPAAIGSDASPYPGSQQQPRHQQLGNDASGNDNYGQHAIEVEGQSASYLQQDSNAPHEPDNAHLDQFAISRHAQDGNVSAQIYASNEPGSASAQNELTWSPDPAQVEHGGHDAAQSVSSGPGTSHDQRYERLYTSERNGNDGGDANAVDDSGLEKVMLTRPMS